MTNWKEDPLFEQKADAMLSLLEGKLSVFDPDEIDVNLSGDALTIKVLDRETIVINRHLASKQIWMSALRKAWHFDATEKAAVWRSSKSGEELVEILNQTLSTCLGKRVHISEM